MRVTRLMVLLLCSCGRLCPTLVPLTGLDGGTVSCVQSTDCPREANVYVCTNTEDALRDCVECVQTACVRHRPVTCP